MPSVTVTATPQSVRALLGLDDGSGTVLWRGKAQNADPVETVRHLRSATQPDAGATAFRHPPGSEWELAVLSDDGGPTWVWSEGVDCEIVLERDV